MFAILLILLWLVSPIVLTILYIVQLRKNSALKRENLELTKTVARFMNKDKDAEEKPAETAVTETAAAETSAAESVSQKPPQSASLPYNMPRYSMPMATEKPSPAYVQPKEQYAAPLPPKPAESVPKPQDAQTAFSEPIFTDAKNRTPNPPAADVQPVQPLSVPQKRGGSVSTINIILILGALLLSLSGFIFAIATWGRLNTVLKSVVLLSFSVLFFGIHSLTERKLKLPQTGRIFYILGSIFLPSAIVAAGILKVFGEYFSFYGEGRAAVLSAVFLSVCIPFFKGAHDYKNRFFSAVSYYSFSAALVSAIWQVSPNGDMTSLLTAIFALLIVLLEPAVQKLFKRLFGEENVFAAEWNRFSVINAWALSVASLFVADGGFVSLAAFAVFSVCFLTKTVTDKGGTAGAVAFAFFITAAMLSGFDPQEISGFTCIIAATSLIYAVLSVMGIFPDSLKKAMRVLGIIAAGAAGLFALIENAELVMKSETPSVQLIIAAAAIYVQFLVFALRNKTAEYKAMSFGAMLWLTADVFLLIFGGTDSEIFSYILSFAAILFYFAVIKLTPLGSRLYSPANDVILGVYGLICSMLCISDGAVWGLVILLAGVVAAAFSRQKIISAVMCPLLTVMTVFPLIEIFDGDTAAIAAAYGLLLLYFIIARFTSLKEDFYHPALDVIVGVFAIIYSMLCVFDGAVWGFAILLAGAVASAFSRQKIISAVMCPLLTVMTVFPLIEIFDGDPAAIAAAYGLLLLYFITARFTPLKEEFYHPALDVAIGVFAMIYSMQCVYDGAVWGLAILLSGAVASAFSRQKIISGIICPILTVMTVFPLKEIFNGDPASIAVAYGLMLLYFITVRFTKIRQDMYHPVLDIFVYADAFVSAMICCPSFGGGTGTVWSFVILAAGIIAAAVSNQKIISPTACVLLTFSAIFPVAETLLENNISLMTGAVASDASAAVILAVCAAAAVLTFSKKCKPYTKAYGIGAAASVPIFTVISVSCGTADFVPMTAVTVCTVLYLLKSAFPREKYGCVNLLNGMLLITAAYAGAYLADGVLPNEVYWLCFPAVAALLIFAVNVIGTSFGSFENTAGHTEHFLWYAMPALSGITVLCGHSEVAPALTVVGVILGLCTVFLSVYRENTMTAIFPIVTALYVLGDWFSPVPPMIFAIVSAAAGRLIFSKKLFGGVYTDVFSIAAFPAAVIMYAHGTSDVWRWFALLLAAALTANLIRREQYPVTKNTVLTAAGAFIFPLWWTVPFFTVPDLITVQFNLLPLVIFCVILRFIWRDAAAAVYNVSFGAAIFSLVVLFIDALSSGEVFDAVFIGVVIMTMLAVSFIIKRKRWFVLAVAAMVTSAVLLSFSQRDSIAWLVYLAIAGAALIALGVVNELKKQQKKSGEDTKLTRFMSDWTW